jgi:hypothetical protein
MRSHPRPAPNCKPFVFDAGTLVIDLVDAGTNKLLWRGWVEASLDSVVDNQHWMEEQIDEAVARILERLPRRAAEEPARQRQAGRHRPPS